MSKSLALSQKNKIEKWLLIKSVQCNNIIIKPLQVQLRLLSFITLVNLKVTVHTVSEAELENMVDKVNKLYNGE